VAGEAHSPDPSEAGSWCFLGELLTDVDLEADRPPVADRCGSCTLCLDACPTAAFPAPYVLDSRRCISYLTIEHKSAIPEGLRPCWGPDLRMRRLPGGLPWNARPVPGDPELEAADDPPPAAELIGMSREEFNRRFAGTALRRTGRSRLLRNAAVALGNSGDPAAIPALRKALALPDLMVREHARWALERLRQAVPAAAREEGGGASPPAQETTGGNPWT